MERMLELYHSLVASPWWALHMPMTLARMFMLLAVLLLGHMAWKSGRTWVLLCCIAPAVYYLDAAVVQSLGPIKSDTPTLVKTLSNISWLGMIAYLYTLCRKLDRLVLEGKVRPEYARP